MQQHGAAFHVAQETVAQPGAFVRAFDQAGNIGDHEFQFAHMRHTQIGM